MLRISTELQEGSNTRLRLEGTLRGPWVEELRRACLQAAERCGRLELDLTQVEFIDRDGVALLRRLLEDGVIVFGCTRFVCAQLRS